jgi:hypothetical protein
MPTELSETAWQQQVEQLAQMLGWCWMHVTPARIPGRTITPTVLNLEGVGHQRGWPDHVFWHPRWGRTIFVEFKARGGKTSPEQDLVIESLRRAGHRVFVWRPADLHDVEVELRLRQI